MNRDFRYIISGFAALIIVGLLLIFLLLPPEEEPIPIQPVGEQIIDTGNGEEETPPEPLDFTEGNRDRLEVFDNVTITIFNGTSGTGQPTGGQGSGGGGGGTSRDTAPPTVTGIFSRPPDTDEDYTHPFTVTWVGEDNVGGSGIDFCDPPTEYSGPDGNEIVLEGHCTDKAGNVGKGHVTFNYNATRFVPLLSYNLTLSSNVVNVGSNISATATTNDTSVTNVLFGWIDPSNSTETSSNKTVASGSAIEIFTAPNKTGVWKVDAHFNNGTLTDIAVISSSFNVTTTADGGNGGDGNGGGGNGGGDGGEEEQLPTTDAGPDQSVGEETLVSLNGSVSEDVTVILWSQISGDPAVTLIDPDTLSPTFLAPSISHSDLTKLSIRLTFELLVTNNEGASASDTVVITVNDVNKPPVADAGPDQTVNENDLVELAGSGIDPDGDVLTFSWQQTDGPSAELSDANSPMPSFRAPHVTEDTELIFHLEVSDGLGGVSTDSVKITVLNMGGGGNGGGGGGDGEAKLKSTGGSGKLAEGINFGFTVQFNEHTGKLNGNLEYQDRSKDINLHSISITSLTIDGNRAGFQGIATINGNGEYSFVVAVEDNGEPGDEDKFSISIPELDYNVGGTINSGNIQVHA